MTRAEHIEEAARDLASRIERHYKFAGLPPVVKRLNKALALPPGPAPRRLTTLDMHEFRIEHAFWWGEQKEADFPNARIFGGSNDGAT